VTVTPQSVSLVATASRQLTATIKDVSGNVLPGRSVTWSSGNGAVAFVSVFGVVTAIAPGSCTITATVDGKSGTAIVTVTPRVVASILLDPRSLALYVGDDATVTATALDALGKPLESTIAWSSSNSSVVTVDESGHVVARALGSARITATVEAVAGAVDVAVINANVAAMQLQPAPVTLPVFERQQFDAQLFDGNGTRVNGRTVLWSITPPSVATTDQSGVVTGVAPGTATLTATLRADPAKFATATVIVTAPLEGEAALIGRYKLTDAYIESEWHAIPYVWGPVNSERCGGWGGSPGGSQAIATTKQIDGGMLIIRPEHTDTITVLGNWKARLDGKTYDASEVDVGTWATTDGTTLKIAFTSTYACGGFAVNVSSANLVGPDDLLVQSPGVLQSRGYRWKKLPRSP
jgi:uncharacterized protein YjdB